VRDGVQGQQTEGLLQHGHVNLCKETLVVQIPGRGRDDDQASQEIGMLPLQLPVEAHPIELGHAEIAEDEIIALGHDLLEGHPTVAGDVYFVAFGGQYLGQHLRDEGFIFDHQDMN
jgi:hypothetical protein